MGLRIGVDVIFVTAPISSVTPFNKYPVCYVLLRLMAYWNTRRHWNVNLVIYAIRHGLKNGFTVHSDYINPVPQQDLDAMSERSQYRDGLPRHSVTHQYDDRYANHGYTGQDNRYADGYHQEYYDVQPESNYQEDASTTQLRPATVPIHGSSRIPDRIEEVWLKESRGRITFNESDLMDVSKPVALNKLKRTVSAIFGTAAMLGLIGFLALSSAPDLTPEEIIAMRGYAGEQSSKTPFNLASLRDCDDISECGEKFEVQTGEVQTGSNQTGSAQATERQTSNSYTPDNQSTTPTRNSDTTSAIEATLAATPVVTNTNLSDYDELKEIPAATLQVNADTSENTFTSDQLTVLKQWSNVRSSPDVQSEILTSLAEGTTVTLLSQTGNWFEVSAFKRREFIGYMHKSTLSEP